MTPAEDDVVQPAARLVDPVLRHQLRVRVVRIRRERLRVDDLVAEAAANDERVADDVPLSLRAEEDEELAEVVHEPGDLHPVRLAVAPERLRRLEEVLELPDGCVWVGRVDECVELFERGPDG
jgi:hypothetical protein